MTADAGDPGWVVSVAFLAASLSITLCLNSARRPFVDEDISVLKSSGRDVNCGYSTVIVGEVDAASRREMTETGMITAPCGTEVVGAMASRVITELVIKKAANAIMTMMATVTVWFFIGSLYTYSEISHHFAPLEV